MGSLKIRFKVGVGGGGEGSRKTNIQREFPKKGAGGLKGELGEKRQGGGG